MRIILLLLASCASAWSADIDFPLLTGKNLTAPPPGTAVGYRAATVKGVRRLLAGPSVLYNVGGSHIDRSLDRGRNWETLAINASSLRFQSSSEVLAASSADDELYVSNDGGVSWLRGPETHGTVMFGTDRIYDYGTDELRASSDGGKTWTSSKLPEESFDEALMEVSGSLIYWSGDDSQSLFGSNDHGGLFRSNDHGGSWQSLGSVGGSAAPLCAMFGGRLYALGADGVLYVEGAQNEMQRLQKFAPGAAKTLATNRSGLYVFGSSDSSPHLWMSSDEGKKWSDAPGEPAVDFAATAGALYVLISTPDGVVCRKLNDPAWKSTAIFPKGAYFLASSGGWMVIESSGHDTAISERTGETKDLPGLIPPFSHSDILGDDLWVAGRQFIARFYGKQRRLISMQGDPIRSLSCFGTDTILVVTPRQLLFNRDGGSQWSGLNFEEFFRRLGSEAPQGETSGVLDSAFSGSRGMYLTAKFFGETLGEMTVQTFQSTNLGETWTRVATIPDTLSRYPGMADRDGNLFAVSSAGILRKRPIGDWNVVNGPILKHQASDTLINTGDVLVYATTAAIWCSFDGGDSWKSMKIPDIEGPQIEVRSLTPLTENRVVFATKEAIFVGLISPNIEDPGADAEISAQIDLDADIVEIGGQAIPAGKLLTRGSGPDTARLKRAAAPEVKGADGFFTATLKSTGESLNLIKEQGTLRLFRPYRKSYALIIAIKEYPKNSGYPEIPRAQTQAEELAKALQKQGFEVLPLLLNSEATQENIRSALLKAPAKNSDRLLVYFGGHGDQLPSFDGKTMLGYLVPYDATQATLRTKGIALTDLRDSIASSMEAKQVLFALDSCQSGLVLAHDGSRETEEKLRALRDIETMSRNPGRMILTAGTGGEEAFDKDGGFFTRFLIEAIEGKADVTGRGVTTYFTLFEYIRSRVSSAAKDNHKDQNPQEEHGSGSTPGWVFVHDRSLLPQ